VWAAECVSVVSSGDLSKSPLPTKVSRAFEAKEEDERALLPLARSIKCSIFFKEEPRRSDELVIDLDGLRDGGGA